MPALSLPAEPSDAFLLERVGRGDVRAYELIYNRYSRPAHALAHRLCGRRCVAEEVVQEAFLAVWRRAGTYSESRGSARGWIFALWYARFAVGPGDEEYNNMLPFEHAWTECFTGQPVVTLCPYIVGALNGAQALERMGEVSRVHEGVLVAGDDGLTLLRPSHA